MTRNRCLAVLIFFFASTALVGATGVLDERGPGRRPGASPKARGRERAALAPAPRERPPLLKAPARSESAPAPASSDEAIGARLGVALAAHVTVHGGKPGLPDCIHLEEPSSIAGSRPIAAARSILARACAVLAPRAAVLDAGEPRGRGLALAPVRALELGGNTVIVDFESSVDGTPILDSTVKVELRHDGPESFVPVRIWGPFHPDASVDGAVDSALENTVANTIAERYPVVAPATTLVVVPLSRGGYRRAFVVFGHASLTESRRDVIDAETGAILASTDATCSGSAGCLTYLRNPIDTPRTLEPLNGLTVNQGATSVVTAGDGTFPLTGTVTLDKGMSGPLVRALPVEINDPLAFMGAHMVFAPERMIAFSGAADFTLESAPGDESTQHQDEVSAFYAAMSYNTYVQATYPIFVAPAQKRFAFCIWPAQGTANFVAGPAVWDNETYAGSINLGTVNVTATDERSLARDVTIVRHEYTHGLFLSIVPNLPYGGGDGNSLNEFLADYFPCAQLEDPRWGEYGGPVYFRDLSGSLVYPQDEGTPQEPSGEAHRIGNIVGQALWEARTAAEARTPGGRLAIDQAVLEGVVRFPPGPTLAQAREAIVAADLAINGGANGTILATAFHDHGIGDAPPANAPPSIAVAPSVTVTAGEPLNVSVVSVSQNGSPVTLTASSLALPLAFQATTGTTTGTTAQGTLTGTPDVSHVGSYTVTITAVAGTARSQANLTVVVTEPLTIVLATGGSGTTVAPASIASAYGAGLAGATVTVADAAGVVRPATVFYAQATQVNFLVPAGTAIGKASVAIGGGNVASGTVVVAAVAPELFAADSTGLASAAVVRVHADGSQSNEPVSALPIDLGVAAGDEVVLTLYGTGIRGAAAVTVTIGGVSATVLYAGAQGQDPGLDQVNVVIPWSLAGTTLVGKGRVDVVLQAGGIQANTVSIAIE